MNKMNTALIGLVAALSLGLILWVAGFTTENRAISKEEQVEMSISNISTEEERRVTLFNNIVDAVMDYKDYEGDTLSKITEARTKASSGDIGSARKDIDVVVENYPELKAQQTYKQAMKEFSITENRLAEQRKDYNSSVREYRRFLRKTPSRQLLSMRGYQSNDYELLDFKVDNDQAKNLFNK